MTSGNDRERASMNPRILEAAHQLVAGLAGAGVTDDDVAQLLPVLTEALRASPDPERAAAGFARWFEAVGNRRSHLQLLIEHPIALDLFCLVAGCSQYFADLLARNPEYFEVIANPGARGGLRGAAAQSRAVSRLVDACLRPELKRDALRRWKAREMLRIGVRDLAGLADMPVTAREFSNLADACVRCALDVARSQLAIRADPPPFAVIGMGKLGGRELNYSSDIDLIFLHGDSLPATVEIADGRSVDGLTCATRLAEATIRALSEETASGHVFRVDMRLRPEGRFGPLTRSLQSCRAYYESWAEGWERQALLKARPIAGDRALAAAFMAMAGGFVYRTAVSAEFVEEIRANKRRIEAKCALEGETETNVKTGYGGIRDVEFTIQLLQLLHGGRLPAVRTPNTLAAMRQLDHAGQLDPDAARELAEDYQFLRTLEHRLQLLHGFQTQTMPPAGHPERERLARRMGFPDGLSFEAELRERRERVRGHLQTLFYGASPVRAASASRDEWGRAAELLDNLDTPAAHDRLAEMLRAARFRDVPAALEILRFPMRGNEFGAMSPHTRAEYRAIVPRLLTLAAHSADPDGALAAVEAIALAVPNRAQLYAAFDDSPDLVRRLVQLGAASAPLARLLARRLEWIETLVGPDAEPESEAPERAERRDALRSEIADRTSAARSVDESLKGIARLYQRERLRIGAWDAWDFIDAAGAGFELTDLADLTLEALLDLAKADLLADPARRHAAPALDRVAILGLGKLGGEELGYGSDWDIMLAYEPPRGDATASTPEQPNPPDAFEPVHTLAERLLALGGEMAREGAGIEIDLRLRPWGRKGALIYSLDAFVRYHRTAGEMWERQAALKGRFAAGSASIGARAMRALRAVSFGRGLSPEDDRAVREMKRRIETERLKSELRHTDLKLGFGGLTDIEWLAQRLQLLHGRANPALRLSNTRAALSALALCGALSGEEADLLLETYALLSRVRNAIWLRTGSGSDVLPASEADRRAIALRLGCSDTLFSRAEDVLADDLREHMAEARRIFDARFYEMRG
jgi:glutamate-ammonia-ligase adenylyltransferase